MKECLRCGHQWQPKVESPKYCPFCKAPRWSIPKHVSKASQHRLTLYCWRSMMDRCYKRGGHAPHRYKGRGIEVCDRWHVFENFVQDMGLKPDGMQIDRKDNNGHYSPDNCKWSTSTENNNNRHDNRMITVGGETKTMSDMARAYGLTPNMVNIRLHRGWDIIRALTQKPRGQKDATMG